MRPHTLVAQIDRWGELVLALRCPYDTYDPDAPCRMGVEPSPPCQAYLDGDDCPVDGSFDAEFDHLHPTAGCWAQESIGEIGWQEAVRWVGEHDKDGPTDLALPCEVHVFCDSDGLIEIRLAGDDG